jgi:hypothetical protein
MAGILVVDWDSQETAMNCRSRSALIAATMLVTVLAGAPHQSWAQNPAQMEYERQQREYWRQQEQQRQEQQRQQQLMNDNARRQQEESRRLSAPAGQSPTPGYQGATPQMAPRQAPAQATASAATAAAKWEEAGSHTLYGGLNIYFDRVTMRRSGDSAKLWEMLDFKTVQVMGGTRVLSLQSHFEYDCKGPRRRMLATAGFSGHMGKTLVVDTGNKPGAWESVAPGTYQEYLRKIACGKK